MNAWLTYPVSESPSPLREELLRVLLYFDIFQYPLQATEIGSYLPFEAEPAQLNQLLDELENSRLIFKHQEFYSVQDNPLLVIRRKKGNDRAKELLETGKKISRRLARFPFVKGVAVSGSLSKDFADVNADIDFFIITRRNRLWIARTLMHLYKKFHFLLGQQHYYCMNYYVDETALEIQEQNIYTAVEIKTLLPVTGAEAFKNFREANNWSDEWLPLYTERETIFPALKKSAVQRCIEWLASGKPGEWLDNLLFRITAKRWKQKQARGKRNIKGVTMDLESNKHFARSNPGAFREKVLAAYEERLGKYGV